MVNDESTEELEELRTRCIVVPVSIRRSHSGGNSCALIGADMKLLLREEDWRDTSNME